ncbi:DUF4304 domain-containing protein [Fictibacillus iocasae]|uniref:DUF4304 domain-containing protein n=1 Tax=Fictibacillus iocasae TaxID=2715437 RepID=A0ABW2NV11_9BACL
MSSHRDALVTSLNEIVIPHLRERGFKGSLPHFYRKCADRTDLIMFQFSLYGEVLYVEISKCSKDGYTEETTGKHISPQKVKVYQIGGGSPYNRTRIGKDSDDEFTFNEKTTDETARKIVDALDEAEKWWSSYPNWWNQG